MRCIGRVLLLTTLVHSFEHEAGCAEQGTNAYHAIVGRNVFRLKPETLVAAPPQPQTAPPAQIVLTGITTIFGDKRVLLKITPASSPGGPSGVEESCILVVGQREGGVQVLDIDEKKGDVTINNGGSVMTLNIEKDGAKPFKVPSPIPNLPPPPGVFHHRA